MKLFIHRNPHALTGILNDIEASAVKHDTFALRKQLEASTDAAIAVLSDKKKVLLAKPKQSCPVLKKIEALDKRIKRALHKRGRELTAIQKLDNWHREVRVCVNSHLTAHNILYSSLQTFDSKSVELRVKTYFDMGLERDGEFNSNAFSAKGNVKKRQAKYWVLYMPAVEVLEGLMQQVDEDAEVHMISDSVECDEGTVYPYTHPPVELTPEVMQPLTPQRLYVVQTLEGVRATSLQTLNRHLQVFEKGDLVTLISTGERSLPFIKAGTLVRFERTDDTGTYVSMPKRPNTLYNLGKHTLLQHPFVRTVDQCLGLSNDIQLTLRGSPQYLFNMTLHLKSMGLYNVRKEIM